MGLNKLTSSGMHAARLPFHVLLATTLLAYPGNITKYIYTNTDLKVCFQKTQTQEATSFTWHVA